MQPKISIIIPVYNVEPYIAECLQSVMRQTYKGEVECIVVDDCGTDNSMAVAGQLIATYEGPIEFRVLHHDQNRGLSGARNTGMEAACGDFILFVDSDDWITDDCLEKLTRPLSSGEYDIIVGDCLVDGRADLALKLSEGAYFEKGISRTFCNKGIRISSWNKLWRKKFLLENQLQFEIGKSHEDAIFAFDLSCCAERRYYVVRSVTYFYRIREGSINTSRSAFEQLESLIVLFDSIKDRVGQDRYKRIDGIYEFYLFWVWTVFNVIADVEKDETMLAYVQKETKGFLGVIPNIRYLSSKYDRVIYFFCRKDQTYLRFQYVRQLYANKYANRLSGKIMKNVLNLIPAKKYGSSSPN